MHTSSVSQQTSTQNAPSTISHSDSHFLQHRQNEHPTSASTHLTSNHALNSSSKPHVTNRRRAGLLGLGDVPIVGSLLGSSDSSNQRGKVPQGTGKVQVILDYGDFNGNINKGVEQFYGLPYVRSLVAFERTHPENLPCTFWWYLVGRTTSRSTQIDESNLSIGKISEFWCYGMLSNSSPS